MACVSYPPKHNPAIQLFLANDFEYNCNWYFPCQLTSTQVAQDDSTDDIKYQLKRLTGVDPDDFRLVAEVNDMQKSSTDKYHMLPEKYPWRKSVPGAFIFTRGDASGQAQPSPDPAC